MTGTSLTAAVPIGRRAAHRSLAIGFLLVALVAAGLVGLRLTNGLGMARAIVPHGSDVDLPQQRKDELLAATRGPAAAQVSEGEAAARINAALPFSTASIERAAPFALGAANAADVANAQLCLTQAIYYEAGFEPADGRRAVAQVILNRLRHPAFPKNVCGVVYEGSSAPGCQFSFTCDGSLRRPAAAAAWTQAAEIARDALAGRVAPEVGQATHYHTDYVAPYWAPKLTKIARIGAHIFYRWPGGWGLKRAFSGRYAGGERNGVPLLTPEEVAAEPAVMAQAPDDRRAPNDVGGRLDVSKGWTLSIPDPTETRGALASTLAAQEQKKLAAERAGSSGEGLR